MKRRQLLVYSLAALLITLLVLIGCGDTFRPVVNPLPQNGGIPATMKIAAILSNAGSVNNGVLSALDVSGDTNIGEIQVGRGPSSMAIAVGGQIVYVANQTDSSVSTVGGFIPNSVSTLTLTQSISSLPAGILCAAPPCAVGNAMVATTDHLYIAQADQQSSNAGIVIASASTVAFTGQLLVGSKPSTATQLISVPGANKVYSINSDNTGGIDLSSWNATNSAIVKQSIVVGANPVKAVTNNLGNRLFVANQTDGTITVLDTTNDTAMNVGTQSSPSFAITLPSTPANSQPSDLFLNDQTNQLFVASKGSNTVTVINVPAPQGTPIPPPVNPTPTPVSVTIPGPGAPVGVVATTDGTRAFCLTVDGSNTPYIYEVGFIGNSLPSVRLIPLPTQSPTPSVAPVVASYQFGISSDGTKVYLVFGTNSQQMFSGSSGPFLAAWPNVYVINTANDTVTNTTNSVAPLSVPRQSNAAPVQLVVQP